MATVGPDAISGWVRRLAPRWSRSSTPPVSGGTARAQSGELLAMVGGDENAVQKVSPLLETMASNTVVVGRAPGDGQRMKLVNQLLCGVHIAVAAEALAFAEALWAPGPGLLGSPSARGGRVFHVRGPWGPDARREFPDLPQCARHFCEGYGAGPGRSPPVGVFDALGSKRLRRFT